MVRSIFALAAVLSLASVSLAGDLVTPPTFVGLSTSVSCHLANITSAPILAQVELDSTAGVLKTIGPVTLAPGLTVEFFVDNPNKTVWCRFVKASKSKVRASISTFVSTDDGSDHVVVPAQ